MLRYACTLLGGAALLLAIVSNAAAAPTTKTVVYKEGSTELEGVLVLPEKAEGKAPAVVIFHQWMGPTEYETKRAVMLAELGYIAFVADIYGKGVRAKDASEASALARKYRNDEDRSLLRARANAALDSVKKLEHVDAERVAAIGYCFGGSVALELARSGAKLSGIASFHGGLTTVNPADAKAITARVVCYHGADDPYVPDTEVLAFQKEMREAKVDWEFISYGNAVHGFTHWDAGTEASGGFAYHEAAEKRSWAHLTQWLGGLFGSGK